MRRSVKSESAQRSTAVTNRLPLAISSSSVVSCGKKELYELSLPEPAAFLKVRLSFLILYKMVPDEIANLRVGLRRDDLCAISVLLLQCRLQAELRRPGSSLRRWRPLLMTKERRR